MLLQIQVSETRLELQPLMHVFLCPGCTQRYKAVVDCFARVNSEQGFLSFWRGNVVNVVNVVNVIHRLSTLHLKVFPQIKD